MENESINNKRRYSTKAVTIHQLNALVKHFRELDLNNDYQILLMTPYGFLKGDLEDLVDEENFIKKSSNNPGTFDVDLSRIVSIRNQMTDQLLSEDKIDIIDNGAVLNFKNVEIYKNDLVDPIAQLNQMLVFVDHIVSFSIIRR